MKLNYDFYVAVQVERTLGLVQRALQVRAEDFGDSCDPEPPEAETVGDAQFRSYLDPLGTLMQCEEMREAVFEAGVDPALR